MVILGCASLFYATDLTLPCQRQYELTRQNHDILTEVLGVEGHPWDTSAQFLNVTARASVTNANVTHNVRLELVWEPTASHDKLSMTCNRLDVVF